MVFTAKSPNLKSVESMWPWPKLKPQEQPQVSVLLSIGEPFWVAVFDPQPRVFNQTDLRQGRPLLPIAQYAFLAGMLGHVV